MTGIATSEQSNDQQEYLSHLGMQPDRWVHTCYLTIPTAWTQAGANTNLPEASRPDHHHVGSMSVHAAMEMSYLSTTGLLEIGDIPHVALASRSMNRGAARPPTLTALHPLLSLELLIDRDWLLVDHSMPTGPACRWPWPRTCPSEGSWDSSKPSNGNWIGAQDGYRPANLGLLYVSGARFPHGRKTGRHSRALLSTHSHRSMGVQPRAQ